MKTLSGTITGIAAQADSIVFYVEGLPVGAEVQVCEYAPYQVARAELEGTPVSTSPTRVADGTVGLQARIERFDGSRDRLFSRFGMSHEGIQLAGVRYVTSLSGTRDFPYPVATSIKGLQVREGMAEDAAQLGVRHATHNVNQGDLLLAGPGEDAITHELEGRTFYFSATELRRVDEAVHALSSRGMVVTLILLNALEWTCGELREPMRSVLLHPGYDDDGPISAFNVVSENSWQYFRAFVDFVAERYTRPDQRYGRAVGFVIGNEINTQWMWANAGRMSVEDYMREYGVALRTAFYAARRHYSGARIYISLDHLWNMRFDAKDKDQSYHGRRCLELLNEQAVSEGNFDWSVAQHPYPENLAFPDFWNDVTATERTDSPRITFKNVEQLPLFLRQEPFLFEGRCRHIILSEQGFNSHGNEESEAFQAAALALAYPKIEACPEIEAFIVHAHADNLDEFGLHLGLWRIDEQGEPTTPKPIYDVFRDIDGPKGDELYQQAQPFLSRKMDRV